MAILKEQAFLTEKQSVPDILKTMVVKKKTKFFNSFATIQWVSFLLWL